MLMGVLILFKQVRLVKVKSINEEEAKETSNRLENKIFIHVISLVIVATGVTQLTPLGGQVGIGAGAITSLIIAVLITKAKPKLILEEGNRMIQQVGITGILPQLLASLGVVFTAAGVGDVIAGGISVFVPEGNRLLGIIAYVLGMGYLYYNYG